MSLASISPFADSGASSPEDGEQMAREAHLCFRTGRYDRAIPLCQRALKSRGAKEVGFAKKVLFCMAASLYEQREFFQGLQVFRDALSLDPRDTVVANHLQKVEKERSHLLYQLRAEVSSSDSLKDLILRIFAEKKIAVLKSCLQNKIPFYSKELTVYRQSLHAQQLPLGLTICRIEGIGEGIFLKNSASPIPSNRLIGLYAGKFRLAPNSDSSSSSYLWGLSGKGIRFGKGEREAFMEAIGKSPGNEPYHLDIDASERGNFTRFINHSSSHSNCEGFLIEEADQTVQVAFYSKQPIEPGEQLLIDYTDSYWKGLGLIPISLTPQTYQLVDGALETPMEK